MERGVGLLGRDSRTSPPPTRWDLGSAPMKYQVRARNPEAFSCTYARTVWLSTGGLICLVPPEGRDVCKPFRLWHWEGLKGGVAADLKAGQAKQGFRRAVSLCRGLLEAPLAMQARPSSGPMPHSHLSAQGGQNYCPLSMAFPFPVPRDTH